MKKNSGSSKNQTRIWSRKSALSFLAVIVVLILAGVAMAGVVYATQVAGSRGYPPAKAKLLEQQITEARMHPQPKPTDALRIYTEEPTSNGGFNLTYIGTFPAPNGESILTIITVHGYSMQLHTSAGQALTFDLQTNQYQ